MGQVTPEERLLNLIKSSQRARESVLSEPMSQKEQGLSDNTSQSKTVLTPPLSPQIETVTYSPSLSVSKVLIAAVCAAILVILFVYVEGVYKDRLSNRVGVPEQKPLSSSGSDVTPVTSSHLQDTDEVNSVRRDITSNVQVSPPAGLKLMGVISGDSPQAIIEDNQSGQILTLNLGETILGYELTEAGHGQAEFSNGKEKFRLKL